MNNNCPHVCNNKNSLGNCLTTVCINPEYNMHGTYVQVVCPRCHRAWFEKKTGREMEMVCKNCGNTVYYHEAETNNQHVMSIEEIKASSVPLDVFVEITDWDPGESIIYAVTIEKITERSVHTVRDKDVFDFEDYNQLKHGWRLWTSRPTEQNKRVVKWI